MKLSLNWLGNYLNQKLSEEEISEILTNTGLEVEEKETYESIPGGLKGFVIGEVITCEKHPDADKLSVTTVNIGSGKPLSIVCGAPNVAAGQKVVVATVGTIIPHKNGSFEIKKAKIRGAVSEGMICAEDEMGIGESHDGILVLPDDAMIGTPAAEYFGIYNDTILEINITPNRSDATSYLGVAREIVAYKNQTETVIQLLKPKISSINQGKKGEIDIEIKNTDACLRYAGIFIDKIQVAPSPQWLQNKLKAISLKPINNIVDITNFVLFETGQPLHAFDATQIKGKKIVVRNANNDEKFVTLDGIVRTLDAEDLVIANENEPLCIAGVFGGLESGITENTTSMFLESACFSPTYIRKTSRRLGLFTDASFRFERGTDIDMVPIALKRAVSLIEEIAGGRAESTFTDVYPATKDKIEIVFGQKNLIKLLGQEIPFEVVKNILSALEFEFESIDNETLKVLVPHYKSDISRPADLVEEIIRIYGLNKIEIPQKLVSYIGIEDKQTREKAKNKVANYLVSQGFSEILTLSLSNSKYYQNDKDKKYVNILNPLSSELDVMRKDLLHTGLEVIAYNQNHKNPDLKLFEFGKGYIQKTEINAENGINAFEETEYLSLFISGELNTNQWNSNAGKADIYFLKGVVESVFASIGLQVKTQIIPLLDSRYEEGFAANISDKTIYTAGKLNPKFLKTMDLKVGVYFAQINFEDLTKLYRRKKAVKNKELIKFPTVRRDLALILDKNQTFEQIKEVATKTEKKLLKEVNIFDVYEGDKIPSDKKSYAVSFILQDAEKTLTDQDVDKTMEKLLKAFEKELGASLRA